MGIYKSILMPQIDEYFTLYNAFEHGYYAEILASTKVKSIWYSELRLELPD